MKFTLEQYQQRAVRDLLRHISRARRDFEDDGEATAIGLSAPTGAGKTVIATAVLEGLYHGADGYEPDPELTVLWLTDDRSLNAQTISKIIHASGGKIDANRVRFLGDTDSATLEPGFIYFVHIQAMQKNSTLHAQRPDGTRSDHRTHGAWEMIANTVRQRGHEFVVIWDEAHRGTSTKVADRSTIAGAIVNGGATNIGSRQPPAPVVLGISATPDKFRTMMSQAGRTLRMVNVEPSEVRESGLLKDRILLRSLAEDQTATSTMLTLAVEDLRRSDQAWRAHHEATQTRLVEPLLVVQVPTGAKEGRLNEILTTIETAWPALSGLAVAHAFGEPHGPLKVGDRTVRYLPPEAISGDDRARVVLFKSALTTGWDCPRAEVLVSFQGKDSYTEIAQLIGRLVRTPLAERVRAGDERLNEVVAYLPEFRTEHVVRVVAALTEGESVEVEILIEPETCVKAAEIRKGVFETLDLLPTYVRKKTEFKSRTAQLMRLAAALNEHGLEEGASSTARRWITDQMRAIDGRWKTQVDEKAADILDLTVQTTVVGFGDDILVRAQLDNVATSERDLDEYLAKAVRTLPDGSASWYLDDLLDRDVVERDAIARVAAFAALDFRQYVETEAAELIATWQKAHTSKVSRKPRDVRDLIEPLWDLGSSSVVPSTVHVPDSYEVATRRAVKGDVVQLELYPRHLFHLGAGSGSAGLFPVDTSRSSWERAVLERELSEDTLLGWYRNPPSGRHALAVPYADGAAVSLMHPDFLFFHDDSDGIVVDIVDPHRHDASDASPKWAALAEYAARHSDRFRRVIAVIQDARGVLRGLDLCLPGMPEQVGSASSAESMESLFEAVGFRYE